MGLIGGVLTHVPQAHAAPTGNFFDHIVVVAMENTPYAAVLGSGSGNSNAPFLSSMLPVSSSLLNLNNYGATSADGNDFNGCSAACYVGFMFGNTFGVSDGYSISSISGNPEYTNRLAAAGLTYQLYCSEGCPRGADHFPFPMSDPNAFTGSSVTFQNVISAANSATPPNLLWFTPTDGENMHDNSVSSGDSYLKNYLVGTGSISSPSGGTLLSSSLFMNPAYRTLLLIWWDECGGNNGSCNSNNAVPNLWYGATARRGYLSSDTVIDEYSTLRTLLSNWGLNALSKDSTANSVNDVFGSSGPLPLQAAFTLSPSNPIIGQPVTFTATASGGTSPYTYSWNLGGSAQTGNPATVTFSAQGSVTASLTLTDSAGHTVSSSQTFTVTSGSGTGGGIGSATNPPRMAGWGGNRLDSVTSSTINPNGGPLSNMELVIQREQTLGYNTIRVDFDPFCTDNTDFNYMSAYNAANLQSAIALAQRYNFWIVVDYHGYVDFQTTSAGLVVPGSSLRACWLTFWSGVVTQFKNSYTRVVWEPLNEPCFGSSSSGNANCIAGSDVASLSAAYQAWINQARAIGDNHWIVVQNICSNSCSFADFSQGYPTVTDPDNLIFISLHAYMGYPYVSPWTTAEADSYAYQFYQWMITGQQRTGWPSLNTEMGADPLCSITACPNAGWVLGGSAGYTTVTLEFMKRLTTLLNTNPDRPINWIGWTSGSWTDTPGSPITGAIDASGWGTLLGTINLGTGGGTGGGSGFLTLILSNPTFLAIVTVALIGGVSIIALGGRKKRGTIPAT